MSSPDAMIACMVAADALAEGNVALATSILDAQAPGRLDRECPRCASPRGKPCRRRALADEICPACSGTTRTKRTAREIEYVGVAPARSCSACDGTGRVVAREATEQLIPCAARVQ